MRRLNCLRLLISKAGVSIPSKTGSLAAKLGWRSAEEAAATCSISRGRRKLAQKADASWLRHMPPWRAALWLENQLRPAAARKLRCMLQRCVVQWEGCVISAEGRLSLTEKALYRSKLSVANHPQSCLLKILSDCWPLSRNSIQWL